MIKKLRVTVDGKSFDVTVEVPEDTSAATPTTAPAPVAPAPPKPLEPILTAPAPSTATPAGAGDVTSPLAGRVIAVIAQVGQMVKENDHLLTIEAMKMNTFVFAPKAGKITEIKATVGDAVLEGQVLARMA